MTSRARTKRMKRRPARSRGYTVVEVLSAMTLFAIGAAGVIGMQRVTIQGGTDARRFDVASNIASQWAYRLQRDSMGWSLPNADDPGAASNLGQTRWLGVIADTPDTWIRPTVPGATPAGVSPAFDVFGRDLTSRADAMYCVQYRLNWLANPGTGPGGLIRGEVRVIWARLNQTPIGDCSSNALANPNPTQYHAVYLSTAIRQNPTQ